MSFESGFVSCCEVQKAAGFPDRCGEEVTAMRVRVRSMCAKLLFLSCDLFVSKWGFWHPFTVFGVI